MAFISHVVFINCYIGWKEEVFGQMIVNGLICGRVVIKFVFVVGFLWVGNMYIEYESYIGFFLF